LIDTARDILDTELTAMSSESYQRAYNSMVTVQILAELEEVIQYKLVPEKRERIKQMWWERLKGCQRVVEDWQNILQVRSIVISPQEDVVTQLKFASLCRKNGRMKVSHKILSLLKSTADSGKVHYAYTKHLWSSGEREAAFGQLSGFVKLTLQTEPDADTLKLLSRCYLRLGDWQENMKGLTEEVIQPVLR